MTARPEQQMQRALFGHIRWLHRPGVFAWHVPNGGWRSPIEGKIFKGLGVVPGLPDMMILRDGRLFCLELKAGKGRLSPAQLECHDALTAAGATVATAFTIDQALARFKEWEILR